MLLRVAVVLAAGATLLITSTAQARQRVQSDGAPSGTSRDLAAARLIFTQFGADSLLGHWRLIDRGEIEIDTVVLLNPTSFPEAQPEATVGFVVPGTAVRQWSTERWEFIPIRGDSSQTRSGTPRLRLLEIEPARCRAWVKADARCFNVVHWTFLPPQGAVPYPDWWPVAWYTVVLARTSDGWRTLRANYGEP